MSNISLGPSLSGSKACRHCATGILPLVFWIGLIDPTGFAAHLFGADAAAQPLADHTRSLQSAQSLTEDGLRPSQAANSIEYRGYSIRLTEVAERPDFPTLVQSVRHQVDIVEAVGLNAATLQFFRSLPIMVKPGFGPSFGHYAGNGIIELGASSQPDDRPILLHEFMHAVHFHKLPGGVQNPDVLLYYEQAKKNRLYPEGSYVLSNPTEFFAITASLFLHGRIARPPFVRKTLKTRQPDYYAFLVRIFDVDPP